MSILTVKLVLLAMFPAVALAAWPPVAVTDPIDSPAAVACALIVDGKRQADVPLQPDRSCRIDVSWLSAGARRVQVVAVYDIGGQFRDSSPTPVYGEACALVVKPSTSSFRIAWANVVTCTKTSGCTTHCP